MNKVKILYMLDTLMEKAGSERNLFDIVTNLDRERFEPLVICMRGGNMIRHLRELGIEVIDIALRKIYTPAAFLRGIAIYRLIRSRGISIVVTYHESSDFYGSIIARLARVPVVLSSRRDMGYQLGRRHIFIYRFIDRLFDRIITVSDAVKDVIVRREHVPWHKLIRIYNGVDVARFDSKADREALRKELGLEPGCPVVGILAALRPVKGHQYFLEAAARVLQRFPNAYFLVVGWVVKDEYYRELRMQAKELGIEDRVVFTGGRGDTPDILRLFDVAVFASINEGFSNAVIEAMVVGKPVIATRNGGTAEALVDGESGILIEPRDAESLARSIIAVLEDKNYARELGMRARTRVQEMFTLRGMMRETEGLYENLLAAKENIRPAVAGPSALERMAMRSIKQGAGALIYYLGIMHALNRILPRRAGIKILAYHRVTDNPFVLPGMSIPIAHFEQQIRYIARHCTPLSLEAAVDLIERRENIPENAVVVTFDDGYRDNYVNAFSILRHYRVPATIFLSARAIDEGTMLWFDTILEAFRVTRRASVSFEDRALGTFILRSAGARLAAAERTVNFAKRYSLDKREDFVRHVLERLNVTGEALLSRGVMMSWDDVRAMRREGVSFGSHGMNHVILTRLSKDELRREIGGAKELIRRRSGIDTAHFAYPNGEAGDFNRDIEKLLHRYDYATACTLVKGLNDCTANRLTLRRYCVTEGMESNAFGRHSKSLFAVMLAGFLNM